MTQGRHNAMGANRLPRWLGEACLRRHRVTRCGASLVVATWVVSTMVGACATEVKHRWLVFFFDGVPPLDFGIAPPEMPLAGDDAGPPGLEPPRSVKPKRQYYHHPAYWENRCGGCHASDYEGLVMTPREGLCTSCHPDKPPKKKFVHGPVAVNGCLACHRYHKSLYPKVLIAEAQELCFYCHEMEAMRTDEHHATIETERCIECHDAHGGDDRFFLIKKPESIDSP